MYFLLSLIIKSLQASPFFLMTPSIYTYIVFCRYVMLSVMLLEFRGGEASAPSDEWSVEPFIRSEQRFHCEVTKGALRREQHQRG